MNTAYNPAKYKTRTYYSKCSSETQSLISTTTKTPKLVFKTRANFSPKNSKNMILKP